MLANGITLAVKKKGASDYVELQDLKEVPELGVDAEKVDNTRLKDSFKHSELGIGDPGDMAYKFVYDNSNESSDYRVRAGDRRHQRSGIIPPDISGRYEA